MVEVARLIRFAIPSIPPRTLAPNAGGGQSRRNPWAVQEAKNALREEVYYTGLSVLGPQVPHLDYVDIWIEYHISHGKRPKDGRYRFTDPQNGGGDVAKPTVDALVNLGLIDDDDYKHVRFFITSVVHVETIDEEQTVITVSEVVDEQHESE